MNVMPESPACGKRLRTLLSVSWPVAASLALLFGGCQLLGSDGTSNRDRLVVRSGESFGFCIGYCKRVLEIDRFEERLVTSTYLVPSTDYPTITDTFATPPQKWDSLTLFVDETTFRRLDSVYGCPDCADGGSEWVEIDFGGGDPVRVTFEYGGSVDGIEDLIGYARQLRRAAIDRGTEK